jgi:protein subunit release factor B
MGAFPVSSEKEAFFFARMQSLGVKEEEIEEHFVRSGGAGGQKVNKSSSCVVLLHKPTGIRVKCQIERSQALNRFLARRILLDKIEEQQKGFVAAERSRIEKIRRQKKKRSKRAKEKMLQQKHQRSETKDFRKSPGFE